MHVDPFLGHGARPAALTLVTLQSLPCGCVAAVYRADPTVVEVELVEAKGPHCRFYRHRAGEVLALGAYDSPSPEGGESQV